MGGRDLSVLGEGAQLVKQQAPQRIALGEVAFLVRPAGMCELEVDATVRGLAQLEGSRCADRIARPLDAFPRDLVGIVRRDFPHEGRAPGIGQRPWPTDRAAAGNLGSRPPLEAMECGQGAAYLGRIRLDVDCMAKGMTGQDRLRWFR